jgi:ubiquitin carboxyl-terminal hydrolase 7
MINKNQEHYELLVRKTGTVADVISHLAQKANVSDELARRVRIFETHGHRNQKDLTSSYPVVNLSDYGQLCADLRSEDELQPGEEDRIVHGFNFDREQSKGHSYPFSFLLKEGELFSAAKERIAKRINVKGKGLEKIKFAVVAKSGYNKPEYLTDGIFSRPISHPYPITDFYCRGHSLGENDCQRFPWSRPPNEEPQLRWTNRPNLHSIE